MRRRLLLIILIILTILSGCAKTNDLSNIGDIHVGQLQRPNNLDLDSDSDATVNANAETKDTISDIDLNTDTHTDINNEIDETENPEPDSTDNSKSSKNTENTEDTKNTKNTKNYETTPEPIQESKKPTETQANTEATTEIKNITETTVRITETPTRPIQTQEPTKPATTTPTPTPTAPPPVTVVEVSSVNISENALSMNKNGTYFLTASVSPSNATNQTLAWESSNSSVVSVKNGKLTALSAGSAVITVKSNNGKTAQCNVTVTVPVQSITVKVNQKEVNKGTEFEAVIEIFPSDATDKSFTVSSSNENILRKSGSKWLAYGAGTAKITASSSNGITGSFEVAVVVPVESVKFETAQKTVKRYDTFTLNPTVLPADATNKTLTYKSDNQNVLTVLNNGTIYAAGAGTANITCISSNGIQASCQITVTVPVEAIYVEIGRYKYKTGETAEFKVTIYPEDATDKSYNISITGSGGELAGNNSNSVLCNSSGVTTITATASNGVSGKRNIEIIDLNEYAAEVLRLTNIERQKAGLPDLVSTDGLKKTALTRAKELITLFSHSRPDGSDCFTAYDENSVTYWTAGENIAAWQSTPEEVINDWMNSPGHRANILSSEFGRLGVGVEMDSNGRLYWSQNFTD
ncbi:MAG: Ig-like domain-containing protein [Oscillospiraceae bacterium]|nr:Ig-like domain-containing protein [Oscillospiraceae bacterium]